MLTTLQLGAKAEKLTSKTAKCFVKHITERKETDSSAANKGFAKERVKSKLQLFCFLSVKTIFYLLKKSKLANKKIVLLTVVPN